jgi:hypothetical protein
MSIRNSVRPHGYAPFANDKCLAFSNDWLNFKHPFWAPQRQEKGIFWAFHSFLMGSTCGISSETVVRDWLRPAGCNPAITQRLIVAASQSTAGSSRTSPIGGCGNCSRLRMKTLHCPSSHTAATVRVR